MRAYVLRAMALVACVAAVLLVVFLLVSGFVKADSADFEGLVASVREAGISVDEAKLVQDEAVTVAAFTLQSKSNTDRVDAADKAAEEKILRQAQQFKDKGLEADEVSFTVLNEQGEVILAMRTPLDRTIDPAWYQASSARDADVTAWARSAVAADEGLKAMELADASVVVEDDGARALNLHFAVQDVASGQEAISKIMRDFRWQVGEFNATSGASIGLVRITVTDAAGAQLVDFVADLQLQHDQAWLAEGVLPPGPSPMPATHTAQ